MRASHLAAIVCSMRSSLHYHLLRSWSDQLISVSSSHSLSMCVKRDANLQLHPTSLQICSGGSLHADLETSSPVGLEHRILCRRDSLVVLVNHMNDETLNTQS